MASTGIKKRQNAPCWKLLFDETCPLCKKFAEMIEGYDTDGAIEYISLQEFAKTDTSIPLEELLKEVHMIGAGGEILRGSEAVCMVIDIIPKAKPLRWMIETRWGRKGTDSLYRALKKFRGCRECDKR